jgi:NAD(P)-dependent dehydrogenase (short-subunit alcohol dehydrogenase family)
MTFSESTVDERAVWQGRRVVVTGGTSGLGRALVARLSGLGAHVGTVARGAGGLAALRDAHPGVALVRGDVGDKDDTHRIAQALVAALGGVDVLVHNASELGPTPLRWLGDTDCEDLERALAVNVVGPQRLTRALLGSLVGSHASGRGAVVVTVSSDAAVTAYPRWGAYGASKAALLHMTRVWDEEMRALGVRFLSFDPGDMDTPLHALAVPDADRSALRRPAESADELLAEIGALLLRVTGPVEALAEVRV